MGMKAYASAPPASRLNICSGSWLATVKVSQASVIPNRSRATFFSTRLNPLAKARMTITRSAERAIREAVGRNSAAIVRPLLPSLGNGRRREFLGLQLSQTICGQREIRVKAQHALEIGLCTGGLTHRGLCHRLPVVGLFHVQR